MMAISIARRVGFLSFEFVIAGIIFAAWYMNKTTGDYTVTKDNLGLYLTVLAFSYVTSIVITEFFVYLMEKPGYLLIWGIMGGVLLLVQTKYKRAK